MYALAFAAALLFPSQAHALDRIANATAFNSESAAGRSLPVIVERPVLKGQIKPGHRSALAAIPKAVANTDCQEKHQLVFPVAKVVDLVGGHRSEQLRNRLLATGEDR